MSVSCMQTHACNFTFCNIKVYCDVSHCATLNAKVVAQPEKVVYWIPSVVVHFSYKLQAFDLPPSGSCIHNCIWSGHCAMAIMIFPLLSIFGVVHGHVACNGEELRQPSFSNYGHCSLTSLNSHNILSMHSV